ncbi:hypothetical protein [Neptunicella sp.]|uniref:hypothetical protein n=1 Tax=Neptunicella sp. TaxID=2125986 RepID=UPI003F68FB37
MVLINLILGSNAGMVRICHIPSASSPNKGAADVASLYLSVKRWTGLTPSQLRLD